jgi:SulP family sulfate permease
VNQEDLLFPSLRGYQREWISADVLAGLTLVAIAIPEQMATARLANMPAVTGLYALVAGSLLFAAFGRGRQLSVGADSTIAPVMATGVAAIAVLGSPHYIALVSMLALIVGVLVAAVGLLRLGWIAEFLSAPVITGILAGISVQIVLRQLPAILGLAGGGTTAVGRLRKVSQQLGHTNGWAVGIAVGVFAVIIISEKLSRRIPGALIGLVASILFVSALGLKSHGVEVLGSIHGGLPSFGLPSGGWKNAGRLIGPALTIAFICIAQTAATVRAAGTGPDQAEDFNRDLIALGVGSLAAGLSGSFAVNASPPRTQVVISSGGKSQVACLVAAAVALVVVLVATGLLKDLPEATLGAILLFVATRLFRPADLRAIMRFDRFEFALALITMAAVAFLGTEQGVVVAMLLALGERTRRAVRPLDAVLGREPGTDHWIPVDIGKPTEQVPGVVVYLLYAPLWYANADFVAARIRTVVTETTHTLVLDANGVSDIDFTGARALGALVTELKGKGVTMAMARASHLVHHDLKHGGILATIGADRLFDSVEDAVKTLAPGAGK